MIIENQYGRVDFNIDFSKYKKIGLKVSGGADSALLIYLLLTMIVDMKPDVKIIPITGVNIRKGKWKVFKSQEILDYYLTHMFPEARRFVEDRKIIHMEKQEELNEYVNSLFAENVIDLNLAGLTCNPPLDVMEKHDLMHEREPGRDSTIDGLDEWFIPSHMLDNPSYTPFRNVDKRWVAQCYHDYGLMEYIYPLTVSCERLRETPELTDNEEPCGHCWWCREKKMAFGMMDGGYDA